MADLTSLLLGTLNPQLQKQSSDALKQAELSNYPEFLKALATELIDPKKNPLALRAAGLILKNAFFDNRSESVRQKKFQDWIAKVPEEHKQYIRGCVLQGLISPVEEARKSAAQVVGALGVLEISIKQWPDLIRTLHANATYSNLSDDLRINTLEAMGYLCENLNPSHVSEEDTNSLLTAIVENMKVERHERLRVAAVTALLNTLDFANRNMEKENERNIIVMKICEAAQAPNSEIKSAAFGCMSKLAELYYPLLNNQYMEAFYKLTFHSVKADEERVALNALEFWSSLCEQEIEIRNEIEDAKAYGSEMPERKSQNFIHFAMKELVDLITSSCLKKQAEELSEDEDDWDLAMAGGTLLGLIAQCEREQILPIVMPFVQQNLPQPGPANWRSREAGLMAFGKILDGPETKDVNHLIREGLRIFPSLMDPQIESKPQVRDTASWVLGVICEFHKESIEDSLTEIVNVLIRGLADPEPIVASKCALSIESLASAYEGEADNPNSKLSRFLNVLLPSLLQTSDRPDSDKGTLRGDCFEAINSVVTASADNGMPIIVELLKAILEKLHRYLSHKIESSTEKELVDGMIQYCCGTLLVISQKLRGLIQPQAETIMALLLRILQTHNGIALVDAHLVVGSVANALQRGFIPYYDLIMPYVMRGLKNSDDYQICQTATELVSDISRAVGERIFDQTNDIISLLLMNIASQDLNRVVKPPTIAAFGDIALSLNEKFDRWADPVLGVLELASNADVDREDQDLVDYLNELRESVFESYTGILQALGKQVAPRSFNPRLDAILTFIMKIAKEIQEPNSVVSDAVIKGACGLLGDLAQELGDSAVYKIHSALPVFLLIVERCINSPDADMAKIGTWARSQIGLPRY